MSPHDYSPNDALELLLRKLRDADPHLARQVEDAINAGKDIEETEQSQSRRKRRHKPRIYRKTVPFSNEEALQVALEALEAYFVELPLCVNVAVESFRAAAVSPSTSSDPWTEKERVVSHAAVGSEKALQVDLQTETRVSPADKPTFSLERVAASDIAEQRENIRILFDLLSFMDR